MVKLATPEQAQEKKATRAAFGVTLAELAAAGKKVVAVDADLTGSTTTKKFAEACPENAKRLFNVGIAEQNMIDVAAGLSLRETLLIPVRLRYSALVAPMIKFAIPCAIPTSMLRLFYACWHFCWSRWRFSSDA